MNELNTAVSLTVIENADTAFNHNNNKEKRTLVTNPSEYFETQYSKRRKLEEECSGHRNYSSCFQNLPVELIHSILSGCDMVSLIQLSSTCRRFNYICKTYHSKWKILCIQDFNVYLTAIGKFSSFYEVYRLIYSSRILIGSYIYARYFNNLKVKPLPNWLMIWASLSVNPPIMRYGKDRITRRIRGHYLKKLYDLSYGQVKAVYDLKGYKDVTNLFPTRQQRGTIYFPWHSVRYAAIRKYGGVKEYEQFLLDKCYRSRGFIERNYEKVKGSNPLNVL